MKLLNINANYHLTSLHQIMASFLGKEGVETQNYVATYNEKLSVITLNDNVILSECFNKWDRVWFDYKQSKILADIQNKIDVKSFDCIHAHTLFTDGNTAHKLHKKYKIPYVVAIRNTDVNVFLKKMIHLRKRGVNIMKSASAIIFLSNAYKEQVFEKYVSKKDKDFLESKSFVIPNGIDEFWLNNSSEKTKPENSQKDIKLIYAGRIDKNKNIGTTQKAVEKLVQMGYKASLTVVGKVQDENEFKKIQNAYTNFLPAVPKEELIKLYKAHDIFVMPSKTETFGLVYAEAMSQGLPVIYTRGQGFDGNFEDGEVGFCVNCYDENEIFQSIINVLKNYNQISKNCITGCKKFDWEIITKKYKEIYKEIV